MYSVKYVYTNFYITDFNKFWLIHRSSIYPHKCIRNRSWSLCEKVKGQHRIIIWRNLVLLEYQCCIPSSKIISCSVLEKIFKGFYHIWKWWSYDHICLYKFKSPCLLKGLGSRHVQTGLQFSHFRGPIGSTSKTFAWNSLGGHFILTERTIHSLVSLHGIGVRVVASGSFVTSGCWNLLERLDTGSHFGCGPPLACLWSGPRSLVPWHQHPPHHLPYIYRPLWTSPPDLPSPSSIRRVLVNKVTPYRTITNQCNFHFRHRTCSRLTNGCLFQAQYHAHTGTPTCTKWNWPRWT